MKQEISIKQWVRRGKMLYATDALDWNDPAHPYQQALEQGVKPEEFGIQHPLVEKFKNWNRDELIQRIVELEDELYGKTL